jgi:ElaB/YqjD/DUF883 family membrane-anchored ribosome-binding protein
VATEERQDGASSGATEKVQEVATQAREQALQKADEVKGRASGRLRGQLDTRSTEMADRLTPFAQALHKAGDHLELQENSSGAKAAHRLADQADQLSGYLRRSGADLLSDIEGFARRRPWAAGGIGVALGFIGARFLKASSETRYATMARPHDDGSVASDLPLRRGAEVAWPEPQFDDHVTAF